MKTNHQRGFRGQPDNTTDCKLFTRRLASGKMVWAIGASAEEGRGAVGAARRRRGAKHHIQSRDRADIREVIHRLDLSEDT